MPTIATTYLPTAEAAYLAARAVFVQALLAQLGQPTGYANHRRTTWADIVADVSTELDALEMGEPEVFPQVRSFLATWGAAMTLAAVAEAMAQQQLGRIDKVKSA